METNFGEIVKEDLKTSKMKPGSLIKGKIMEIQKNWVVVDTNLKTESVLSRDQFEGNSAEEIHVGDEVELLLEAVENGLGQTQVSYGKAKFWRKWLELEEAAKEDREINGLIRGRVKGGFSVYVGGIKCFLPGSLIDIAEGVNPMSFENTEGKFKIVKISRNRYNIVLSHKSMVENKDSTEKHAFFESLMKAGKVHGKVKKIVDFGAFIDLGKGEGLVYIADIIWKRINHPSEVLSVGEEYDFKVIDYNREKGRLSLSLREMYDNPWDDLEGKIKEGQKISGTVTKIDNYGFFVEVKPGIAGLVHTSEIDWAKRAPQASNYVSVGDKVDVQVLAVDIPARRISLGYKQCFNNPWQEYAENHATGDILELPITRFHKVGLFLKLTDTLEGFVHSNNIDWDLSPEQALKHYKKSDVVKAKIILMDPAKEKVTLSIKHTIPNAFMQFSKKVIPQKTVMDCTIASVNNKGAIVTLEEDGIDGFIPANELTNDKMKDPADIVKVGEKISAMVKSVDKKNKRIVFSYRVVHASEEKEAIEKHREKKGGFISTLGEIFGGSKDEEKK